MHKAIQVKKIELESIRVEKQNDDFQRIQVRQYFDESLIIQQAVSEFKRRVNGKDSVSQHQGTPGSVWNSVQYKQEVHQAFTTPTSWICQ
jgi:hypothetical protein